VKVCCKNTSSAIFSRWQFFSPLQEVLTFASPAELEAVHTPALVSNVFATEEDPHYFTSDTYSNKFTAPAARLAAGACVDIAVAVATGAAPCGAAICRPPGHHAESGTAMGFCFFNNAAVAARAAQRAGAKKVMIMDWDIHHGNGTQHIFQEDDSVMYVSIHRYDGGSFFPGSGAADEVGHGNGKGYTVNIPWDCAGATDGDYITAFNQVVLPIAYQFSPDLIIISAGFDAAKGDPIGGCLVTPEAFGHFTAMLKVVAPLAVLLEGGYNLTATAASVEQVLRVLLGERPSPLKVAPVCTPTGRYAVAVAQMVQCRHWSCLDSFKVLSSLRPPSDPESQPSRHHSDSHQFETSRFEPLNVDLDKEDDVLDIDDPDTPGILEVADLQPASPFSCMSEPAETPPPDLPAISEGKECDFGTCGTTSRNLSVRRGRLSLPSPDGTSPKTVLCGADSPHTRGPVSPGVCGASYRRLQFVRGLHIAALRRYAKRKADRQLSCDGFKSPKLSHPAVDGYTSA